MGLWQRLIYGTDLEAEQARADALDAQLREMNTRDYGPGGRIYERIEAERGAAAANRTYQQVLTNLDKSATGNVTDQVHESFWEGWNQSFENQTSGIRSVIAAPFKFLFAILPWQVWVVGIVALFLYMGGGIWLRGLINRHFR